MLVDNKVEGDSRVQKIARSAAEAGWDVTLLGRSPDGTERTWRLGAAEVRLLPVPEPLHRRRHEFRRSLRWPLAYRSGGVAEHRAQWVRAWRADLAVRGALVARRAADGELAGARLGRARSALRRREVAARLLDRWVWLRTKMMNRVRYGRRFRGPWDRAYTLFWQLVQGDRAWRRLEPGLWDYELAYGPEVDRLRPDLIHAHDFRMLGVGARAKIRAAGQSRRIALVWDAHEFLPGIKPWRDHARWLPAHRAHEREYAPYADAVLTVSADLAELLRREHRLAEAPGVLLNAPADEHRPADDAPPPDLRAECGIAPEVPLLVYSGAAAPQRGLDTLVEALPRLPGVHLALVVNPALRYVERLAGRAARLGAADRLHVLPYVPHWQVVPFLSGADVGVIPIHRWPNHEIALITKFFEYAHARLPVVVSDVRTMAATVRETGQGEVFRAGDVDDLVRAVTAVLADPARHRAAYDRPGLLAAWTWSAQAEVLEAAYRRLLPDAPPPPDTDPSASSTSRGALRCPPQT
ncbi:glycosyltransferase family 4 protein [Micromonospora halotolerans]|uniref:Glycosyltransferase family 4 protein n=1 Tax=Micromonospora halotolerans TaxID=709879 RepID=A0ABZ0A6K0_9ACTN|nr:glycosyltransferase family 4 protein [Micromonospora halotolerans]WNM43183.1 glycosyltransferase family 4 protein [Micromonospora halotolerans]